jgi:hypothetical protein
VTDAPSRDEFEAWKADPVTAFVMAGVKNIADAQATDWFSKAWGGGNLSEVLRERLKTRADSFMELVGLTVEEAYAANGLPPPPPKEPA